MVASVSIYFDFSGSDANPTENLDVDALTPNLRFKLADDGTIDTNNKLVIPASGTNFSYWKQIKLYCDNPDGNSLDNLKFYSDGTNNMGTGVDLKVSLQFPVAMSTTTAGYELATGSGDSGDEMVANHSVVTQSATVFNYTAGSPLTGPSISEAGALMNATGETSNYLVLQMDVADTASPGELSVDEQCTIQYDEY